MRGFVNIDKPSDMTSSDAVVIVRGILRRHFGEKVKTGHLGTLDPMGTGVLPIALGTAARLFDYFADKQKTYRTTFLFGDETDTLDTTGRVTLFGGRIPTAEEIESVIPTLCGEIDQVPPAYSAKSVGGRRAYDLARAGKEVALSPKCVTISDIKLLSFKDRTVELVMTVSGGTYIRSVCRDMAHALGTYASMSSIRRLRSGCFTLDNAVTLDEFSEDPGIHILPLECILSEYPVFDIPSKDIIHVLNGIKKSYRSLPEGFFAVRADGETVGIGENTDGMLTIRTRL